LHYNEGRQPGPSLSKPMPTSRPKLTLDEQSFQDMLAAAFTIQEHNVRRRREATPSARTCGQCGSPGAWDGPLCGRCAAQSRPGEVLQRKWASMWLMSQEQGMWPDRGPAQEEPAAPVVPQAAEVANGRSTISAAHVSPPVSSDVLESADLEGFKDAEEQISTRQDSSTVVQSEYLFQPEPAMQALRILPDPTVLERDESLVEDFFPDSEKDLLSEGLSHPEVVPPAGLSLRGLRLKLRFHRADFYLVIAIAVSTFAMIWVLSATPAAGVNQKPRLRLWERALISLGVAEAPETPVGRGNPNISVWVDPKTALYYCAGEELYGKAPGGHVATQREAQLDQFEPAGRVPCE